MRNKSMQTETNRLMLTAISAVLLTTGCWWQKDLYTTRMKRTLENWQKKQEIANTLGTRFDRTEEFIVSVMAPKGLQEVAAPTGFVGLLRGGDPPVELVILGSNGAETLAEFILAQISKLNAAQMGPGQAALKQPEWPVTTLFGSPIRYEFWSGQSSRNVAPEGAPANAVVYDWQLFFAEEGSQKVMLGYLIPDSKYPELSPAMALSLQTLALASKFSEAIAEAPPSAAAAAPAGGAGPAPAGGGAAPGAGKPAGF